MSELAGLVEALKVGDDLGERLHSDQSLKLGLEKLFSVLELGTKADVEGKLGLENWDQSQARAVCLVAYAVAYATRFLSVKQAEPVAVSVVEKSLEFAICYLEKSASSTDDMAIQNNMVQLLEIATVEGIDKDPDLSQPFFVDTDIDLIQAFASGTSNIDLDDHVNCMFQGGNCSKEEQSAHRLLAILASERMQLGTMAKNAESSSYQDADKLIFLSRHWAVSHLKCIQRMVSLCKELTKLPHMVDDKMVGTIFHRRLSSCLKILRLVKLLLKDVSLVECDAPLMQAIASFCDALPNLFRVEFDFGSSNLLIEPCPETLVLLLLEEFLQVVQVIFCNCNVVQNIRACIIASVLGSLNSDVGSYNDSVANRMLPLAYFPRVLCYMLKLIMDNKQWREQAISWEEFSTQCSGSCATSPKDTPAFHICSEKILLLKHYKDEELLEIIFNLSQQWLDHLMHALLLLHSEGVKLRPKLERSCSTVVKKVGGSEHESALCQEEEALFGDLFSEGGRAAGAADGCDQPIAAVSSIANLCNMPMQAAHELLRFLKLFVFSPDWHPPIYEDNCMKLKESHIKILLFLLSAKFSIYEDGCTSEIGMASHEQSKTGNIQELCFDLLLNLLLRHGLSAPLEEYLVEEILKVENGFFVYNDRTLTLLGFTFISQPGLAGSQLRIKAFKLYAEFIKEKAKFICSNCPVLKEIIAMLPTTYHIEILLMTFHISSDAEKEILSEIIYSSLREVVASCSTFLNSTQLSCWALMISRLIVVLRHMIYYPRACPPSLLLELKAKLRKAQATGLCPTNVKSHLSSWVSVVLRNLMSTAVRDWPVSGDLLDQLVDIASLPASVLRDELLSESASFSWGDFFPTFSQILGFWRGKTAVTVDDLVVERYLFVLCWDIPTMPSGLDQVLHFWAGIRELDSSNMEHFFCFSHSLLGICSITAETINFPGNFFAVLQQLNSLVTTMDMGEIGWDFQRNMAWLSVLLSLLNVGISKYNLTKSFELADPVWSGHSSRDNDSLKIAEGMVFSIFDSKHVPLLLKLLSSLLNRILQVYQRTFISALQSSQDSRDSPLMLLKYTGFDIFMPDELLQKAGISKSQLESVFGLLGKLDGTINKLSSGVRTKIFWEFLLHGLPSHHSPNGGLISCLLNIKGIINFLDELLSIESADGNMNMNIEVLGQTLDSIMMIKSDKVFASLQGKCESVYHHLTDGIRGPDYSYLFLLKHMESFLTDIDGRKVCETSIHEGIVSKYIDSLDIVRKDPSGAAVFRFFLCMADVPAQVKHLYDPKRGNILVLFDSLDKCNSDMVNVKVLNFLVELMSGELRAGVRQKLQDKLAGMDILSLSKWLERRLLGPVREASDGTTSAKGCSASLRESTMNFMATLLFPVSEPQLRELHGHVFEAMLVSLDTAFRFFETQTVKSFFGFVVQLARDETLMKSLLKWSLMLMKRLASSEDLLQGLKFLFGFFGTVLSDCGSGKLASEKSFGRSSSGNSSNMGPVNSRSISSRKNSESFVLSANQEGGSTSLECDATSADEDEDDGTSDGEVGSLDKDDEDDSNSERGLASKVCTFTSSGSNFMEQHWYFCYTCDLTVSKGCCSVCAKVCHRGHRVVYSRSSRFFCDCGAGGVRGSSCQCLKPRKFSPTNTASSRGPGDFQSFIPFTDDGDQLPDSDSDFDEDGAIDSDNSIRLNIPREMQDRMPLLLAELDVEGQVLEMCSSLLPCITSRRDSSLSKDKGIVLNEDKVLSYSVDLLQLRKAYKSGSLDLKIKADYSNAKELKSHLASGSLAKSLLSVSSRGRLAVGEGDKVAVFDVGQLIGQATIAPVTADKANVKPLSKNVVRFEIVHLIFNPLVESYLAVAGYEDCQVLTVNHRGEVTDRLPIELALQGAYIRRVEWVPGSQVQLMVVTNKFVKIYDLSLDNISPAHYFTLPDDIIVDATLVSIPARMFIIVLSELGCLFRFEISVKGNVGAKPLTEIIRIPDRDKPVKGSSLYFSPTYKLLFLSYQDGTTLIGRLNPDATSLTEISSVYEDDHDGKLRSAGMQRWKELLTGSGLFVCFSIAKCNTAFAVSMGEHEIFAQNLRHSLGPASALVGVTAYKPLSKDKIHCLVLHDDGSLQIYSYIPVGVDVSASVMSEKVKRLGSGILDNKAYAGSSPEFPLDFFEKTICITADVKLSGDAIRNGDSEGAKQSLTSEDGFLESPGPAGFKIVVSNSNPDIVMVGFRVHVGNPSANHIPSNINIFHRVIKLDEGMRSWYDIPFTVAESLLADEEFAISVGPTFSGSTFPRIDSLEVYGRAKDEFGWKEKMEAVLNMEARVLGANSPATGIGMKHQTEQSAPIWEQVVADGLKLLSRLYSLCRPQGCSKVDELGKFKCRQLLETIFESDKEPLLQAAACCVLQAMFPKREIYLQVKDTMRLLGVVKSTALLSSRLEVGGTTARWIIEEFTAQMRAVSKIALHRRGNLATFLETNGSEVVDGLMQVLWGVLDIEQPDTQTMNNIVISSVELIYCYAECLAFHGKGTPGFSVAPAVSLFKQLLFSANEAVQTSSSLAISSRLLQVPFPKQTMLGTDDVLDNATPTPIPADVRSDAGGNSQLMVEEDSITSSVQYSCDGCSTVPILRRRWHCTVCPDFDLCEACYEVLDADQLPPPHCKDHPMSAIPIEAEILGGDSNEGHFSTHDLNNTSLLPGSVEDSTQNSMLPIHVLESNESGEFSASVSDPVTISASKRAVNSLILSELLQQLKGWMEVICGVQAIPVMQLFYRLSSAVGGPFVDSSMPDTLDLEKLVRWFLDEINLTKPFAAKTRCSSGEIAILVFMFFTLMLRNWHQPGADVSLGKHSGTPDRHEKSIIQIPSPTSFSHSSSFNDQKKNDFASQLHRACGSLRQQAFVNYLMDILQQLVQVFKSQTVDYENGLGSTLGTGCGALLTVRRELPAGNFSPFFSDSYAKSHRLDIFADYHRLLLENSFRLVYSLVRPEKHDKAGEKEKGNKISSGKELKLDGYQDVLCSYINNPNTTFVRRYARRLFLHLCGSKTHYYSVRDAWQFSSEVKRLYKYKNKSGVFQNNIPYERSVKILKCLSIVSEVAAARPRNWQKYCLRHGDILPFLMEGLFCLGEESVVQTLKLLNLAFYTGKDSIHSLQKSEVAETGSNSSRTGSQSLDSRKKKGEDGTESGPEKSYMDMEPLVDIFTGKEADNLDQFIDCFLLEWNSSCVRVEAKCVLFGIWHHGKQSLKETLVTSLVRKVKFLPMYGQNIVEYTELVTCFLGRVHDNVPKQQRAETLDRCLSPDVIRCISETLHSQNELLANHPNSRIYNVLSGLVEFDGYYLESEPCVACSMPEVSYSRMKLESLKSETKFTDNRIIVKCSGSYTIQSVTMNVHDARKSKSVKVLNLYYNNRPVADLSELKNNWSLWKRAKSCHLSFSQTELKVDFPIPITACNFMIELDSFYENLQALSLEPLQCPRCSRPVTDKHGICSNCHENAYQCRQCRNINYENLDSFLCNECGYSKYGRFEFNFMAKPSFTFDSMENDEDMKRGLAAIESESENAHRRYQQLLGFKKPLLKIVSSIGENEMDSQQKDSVQQMMVSLPGPTCKINRKIVLLGVLYGEKCKAAFDSVSKSVQTLQGLKRVLMNYLHKKNSSNGDASSRFIVSRSPSSCYGCASTFVTQCLEILQVLSKHPNSKKQLVSAGILSELFENDIHQGPKTARVQSRAVLCAFSEGDMGAVAELNSLIQKKVMYCLEHHRSMDIAVSSREELLLLSEVCSLADEFWESRLRVVFQLLFSSIKVGAKHPAISEHVILPCLRIISQACTPPKPEMTEKDQGKGKNPSIDNTSSSFTASSTLTNKPIPESRDKSGDGPQKTQDIQLVSYHEWEKGASYLDFVRRQYKVGQAAKGGQRSRPQRNDYLALKYALRWKHRACRSKNELASFELGSWVTELVLSACSQSIRSEMCMLITLLCGQSSLRRFRLLNLLMSFLPATLSAGENAAEYFEMLFRMIDSEDALLFLTVRGCLATISKLISQEVGKIESLERSLHIDISQGFILQKLIELLGKFLEVPNIRSRFMQEKLLSEVLEAFIIIRGLIVQKTKLINDCNKLLKDLIDSLLLESNENKRQFIRACINGLQIHGEEKKGRTSLFILEQLCNLICPSKPEPVYLLVLNKAHTQEEFIRGSMTKNPYSSAEVGPLMRDVKNKICHQLDLLGLIEDDYGMELLVAGNIISLDLSVAQVYEQVWRKSNSNLLSSNAVTSGRDCPPMTVTYRLQGLDGEATEPMIKELEEDREESQDPEVEFAIAGSVRDCGGLETILGMIQRLREDLKSNQEQLVQVLNLLMLCCKIRGNRRALLRLGALNVLLETARRAFSVDAMEPAEGILLIVESLTLEANESDNISFTQSVLTITSGESGTGEQAKKIVLMFLERLCHTSGHKKSNKQQRNNEMVARILPALTYGEPAAMEALIQHFVAYLQDWYEFDQLQKQHEENPKDESIAQKVMEQRFAVENFVRVSESLKTSSCGERLKDIILEKGIIRVAVGHLRESFVFTGQTGFKTSAEWALCLKLPSVPLILSMLKGLSMGHLPTQKCIDEGGILPLLHALEGVAGENEIGARAENLLDTLSDKEGKGDGFLAQKIHGLRHATRDEMRRRALKKREQLLQGLGMRQEVASDGGERIVLAHPVFEGLEDVEEEEDGLACMVCREGYSLRPTDLLGVYSYSKRVNLGVGTSGSARGECVYTTVSHFNIIHFQCHHEAKRADAALKNPKKEWEGAAIRNNETLCNNLFPLRGPSVPVPQYVRHVDQYWDNLNALGRADGSRLRLLTYDIVLMLARFATGASFSQDSKGGGKESNSRFLPFMIQMACHLLDQGNASQRRTMAKAVSTYLASSTSDSKSSSASSGQPSVGTEETVQFMMVNSLLSESYESWLQHRRAFLQRGIYHAYMQHTHGRSTHRSSSNQPSPSKEQGKTDDLLPAIQPMLVYTGLIEQLQRVFKVKKPANMASAERSTKELLVGDDNRSLESWEVVMRQKLLNVKEMVGFSLEFLSWLEEVTTAGDIQESFDIIGVLGDVLSGGFSRCEDFVYAAINEGERPRTS